jgi:hypothetical protein
MSMKTIFFYPGIVFALMWTLLSCYRTANYIWYLKAEYPECTQTNDNYALIFFSTILVLYFLKAPIEQTSTKFFMKVIPERKFPLGSEGRQQKADMLGERIFKLIHNLFCVASLFYIMKRPDCDFHDVRILGN